MNDVNSRVAAFMQANDASHVQIKLRRIGGTRFVLADGGSHKLTYDEQRQLPAGYPKWAGKPAADQPAASPDDWRRPYRSMDAGGNAAAAGRVAWNWIEDLGKRLHEQGRDAMIDTDKLSADGFTIQLWEGTALVALATVFRDPMNFSVLVRWAADGVATPFLPAKADTIKRITLDVEHDVSSEDANDILSSVFEKLSRCWATITEGPIYREDGRHVANARVEVVPIHKQLARDQPSHG